MPGIAELALGAAPIAGGAMLGVIAGNLKPPDIRGMITKDLDLLDRLPAEDVERKARLKASIDERIDGLIDASDRTREIREAAMSYRVAIGGTSSFSSARCCSRSSGGTSVTAGPTGW